MTNRITEVPCRYCGGPGYIEDPVLLDGEWDGTVNVRECDWCHGEGVRYVEPCARCGRPRREHTDHGYETQDEVDTRFAESLLREIRS